MLTTGLRRIAVSLLIGAALAGCASSPYGTPINGQQALSPEEQRLQAVETKLADLSRRFASTDVNRDQKYASDLGTLRGMVEQLRYDFDTTQKHNQDVLQAYDARLKALETAQQAPLAGLPPPGESLPPDGSQAGAAASGPVSAAADEEAAYLKSFDLLKAGRYDDAIRGFNAMLAKYPQGNYSDNALYWTGESYNIKKDYTNALASYRALLEKFPASPKVPDALLKTGVILQDQKKTDQARSTYERIIKDFPNSTSATQARNRLAQLR